MRKKILFTIVLVAGLATAVYAGDVVDRIVATVNGKAILQSDWEQANAYEAFVEGRAPGDLNWEKRKAALDRLIDQELIRQQVKPADYQPASAAEVEQRIADIRKQHGLAANEGAWKALLQQYGLAQSDLREKVAVELNELRAVDSHLRPTVQIDPHSIEAYYQHTLLPELRQAGAKDVPLEEVAPKIKELLAQQKINDLLVTWLRNLRSESTIHTVSGVSPTGGGGL
jgi:SurA N-terminal domain